MTSISLHPTPERRTIAGEQLSSVGIALRKEGALFLAALGILAVLGIAAAIRASGQSHQHMGFSYAPGATVPIMLVGLLLPFGVWRDENPARRAYHWAMPVARGPHTLMKVLSGWLWLMAAVIVYLAFIVGLGAVMSYITGSPHDVSSVAGWEWAIPFTAATVAYLLISIAVLGSDHPWRWIGGLVIGYLVVLGFFQAIHLHQASRALASVVEGYYGLGAALFAQVEEMAHSTPGAVGWHGSPLMHGEPSVARWFGSALLWGAIGAIGVGLAAYRKWEG